MIELYSETGTPVETDAPQVVTATNLQHKLEGEAACVVRRQAHWRSEVCLPVGW